MVEALVVVADVEERTDGLRPKNAGVKCEPHGDGNDPIDVEGRKDAQGAAHVKALEGDGAGLFVFLKQQPGDEEAADDEEGENTVARGDYGVACMVEDDDGCADCPEEVELGDLAAGGCADCAGMGGTLSLSLAFSHSGCNLICNTRACRAAQRAVHLISPERNGYVRPIGRPAN